MDSMTSHLNYNNKAVSLKKRMTALVTNPFQLKPLANTLKLIVNDEPHKMTRFCGRGSSRNLLLDQSKLMPITACLWPPLLAAMQYFLVNVRPIRDNKFSF